MGKKSSGPTESLTFTVTLRGIEKQLFEEYLLNHITTTRELYVRPATMARRILLQYITHPNTPDPITFAVIKKEKHNL